MSATPTASSFSPCNLTSMQASAIAWPDATGVSGLPAQQSAEGRRWYAAKAIEHNWSHNVLAMHIKTGPKERSGTAVTTTDEAQQQGVEQSLVNVVAEYALGDTSYPMDTTEYSLTESLLAPLRTTLPTLKHIGQAFQRSNA
jgi:hypothetical protein